MKKFIYSIAALAGLTLASCSNDDIVVETTGEVHDIVVDMNVKQLYTDFNSENAFLEQILRDGSDKIGIYSLLYDAQGNLVERQFNQTGTYNSMTISFNDVPQGEYTLFTIETCVFPSDKSDDGYYPYAVLVEDEQKLSTLKLTRNYYEMFWYMVVGTNCQRVYVGNSDERLKVSTSPIGSQVYVNFTNFNKATGFTDVAFGTTDVFESYRLDPELPESDRVVIDLASSGHFNPRFTRSINNQSEVTATLYIIEPNINYGFYYRTASTEENMWNYNVNYAKGSMNLTKGEEYYGGAYYINDAQSYRTYLGDLQGYVTWLESIKSSSGSIMPDLYKTWGGSVNSVQSFMSGYNMIVGSNGYAEPHEDGYYQLQYKGNDSNIFSYIIYCFTTATTGLYDVEVIYPQSNVTLSQLKEYFSSDDYTYINESDGAYYYASADSKTAIIVATVGSYYYVVFMDYEYVMNQESAPARAAQMREAIRKAPKGVKMHKNGVGSIKTAPSALENEAMKLLKTIPSDDRKLKK